MTHKFRKYLALQYVLLLLFALFLSANHIALAACNCGSGYHCDAPCYGNPGNQECSGNCVPDPIPCGASSATGCECDEEICCPNGCEAGNYKRCVACAEPDPTDPPGPTSTPTRTPTPTLTRTPTPTPTPTLPVPSNFTGVCNAFGGPVSLSWQYSGNGNGYRIGRTYSSGGYDDQHWPLGTVGSINTKTYTDVRNVPGPPENEILAGPYRYYVRSCYDYTTASTCGPFTPALTVNCPTPPPLANLDASCVYPFGPISLSWSNSNPLPAVAETNRHIAKNDNGAWNFRYSSVSNSIFSLIDPIVPTPGQTYMYNIRRCYTEYGTGEGECRYNSLYANQDNVECQVRARCENLSLNLPSSPGCWFDGTTNRCVRGQTVSASASNYNGNHSTPPFDTNLHWAVDNVVRLLYSPPLRVTSNPAPNIAYTIPIGGTVPLGTEIEINTNIRWTGSTVYDPDTNTQVNPICVRGNIWGPSAPFSNAECINSCTRKITVNCDANEWSTWSTPCSALCRIQRTNECGLTEYQACSGGLCASPTVPTYTPTNTPTITNTPLPTVPGATATPTHTLTPIPATPTFTPTLTPTITPNAPTPTFTPTITPTTPVGEPSFQGELFYDFNQNGIYNTGCAAGQIMEKINNPDFGCTGNTCSDCSPRAELESMLGTLPASLEGFEFTATPLGGTAFVFGENPKYRVRQGTDTGFYYFAVQHNNNYRLTNADSRSATRDCTFTTTNPRNVFVGTTNTNYIDVGIHCVPMAIPPTNTPTLVPTLPINTNTPTPTPTPTITNTPTPTSPPEITITGSFEQKTGVFTRSVPGELSQNKLPLLGVVNVEPFSSKNLTTGVFNCHTQTCENLPQSDGPGVGFSGYHCSIGFPTGCSLIIPQDFGVSATSDSSIYQWYGSAINTVNIPVFPVPPPTSYTATLTFTYQTTTGWMKVVGSDVIRAENDQLNPLVNNIPFITDRYDSNITNPIPYSKTTTTELKDLGHASMIDIASAGEVGGVVAGPVKTLPANTSSQFGGSVPSYSLGADVGKNQADLASFVQALLAAKPISYVNTMERTASGMNISLESNKTIVFKADEGMLEMNNLEIPSIATNIFIVTDSSGALADVTFNNDINPGATSSVVIIARSITLASTVSEVNAILIASDTINTGSGSAPLKIRGNVVALNGIIQGRVRGDGDHARPSFLLIFDPKPYFDLMKDLSIKQLEYTIVE